MYIYYHLIAFIAGFLLDYILGDPYFFPHPIRAIGRLIKKLEIHYLDHQNYENKSEQEIAAKKRQYGCCTVLLVSILTVAVAGGILILAYLCHPILGCVAEAVMTYQMLAARCLKVESMKVYKKLVGGTIEEARYAVSMIVGRDTKSLDEKQIARACVETVAENTSDGVIAPMLYLAIGGPILGFLYKAGNTMDSMIGYKNDRFYDFGRCAAKWDDIINYIPARFSAYLMILGCLFLGKNYNQVGAYRIFMRDRYNHASPNSAQTESVMAGALGLRLAGPTSYFGKMVEKPYIGDEVREIEPEDIKRSNRLMYATTFLCAGICVAIMVICYLFMRR